MLTRVLCGLVVAWSCFMGGCATSDFSEARVVRPAVDAPERFVFDSPSSPESPRSAPGAGCRSPMIDPRDGTRLTMVRSSAGQADYAVPAGRYGVGAGELLRLECASGRVLGVVRREGSGWSG